MSGNVLYLSSNNNPTLFIDGQLGNVAICGTSAPNELSVYGTTTISSNLTVGSSNTSSTPYSISLQNSNYFFQIGTGAVNRQFSTSATAGDTVLRTNWNNSMIFQNNSNTCGMYLSNNFLSIGSCNGTTPLDVTGTARIDTVLSTTLSNTGFSYFSGTGNRMVNKLILGTGINSELLNVNGTSYFTSNLTVLNNTISMSNSTGISTISGSSNSIVINSLNTTTLSNTFNCVLNYCFIQTLNNPQVTSLSNLAMTNSNVLYALSNYTSPAIFFSSNLSVYCSNTISSLTPSIIFSSNIGVFNSNLGIYSSNTANTALSKAIFASNLGVQTNYLSNNGSVIFTNSNFAIGMSTAITQLQVGGEILANNYAKKYKALTTSNAINITLNWATPYAVNNQNFICLSTSQMLGSQSAGSGVQNKLLLVGVSNYSLVDVSPLGSLGSGLAANIFLNVVASNSTSITFQSYNNLVTVGNCSHSFSSEILNYSPCNIGLCWLS